MPEPYGGTGQFTPPPFDDDEEGGLNLARYIDAIKRYKWLLAVGLGLGLVAGAVATFVVKPVYEAQASLQLPSNVRVGSGPQAALRSAPLLEGAGWEALLRSFTVLDYVVRQQRLYLEVSNRADSALFRDFNLGREFEPGVYVFRSTGTSHALLRADGIEIERVPLGDSIGRSVGFQWAPAGQPANAETKFRVRTPRDAAVILRDNLKTVSGQDGAFLGMTIRDQDPYRAAVTLNATANRFVQVATLLKNQQLTTSTQVLQEQLENSRVDLAEAEAELQRFKVRTITMPSDRGATPIASGLEETRDPVRQAFFKLRLDRDALIRDRDAVQRALVQARDSSRSLVVTLGTIAAVRDSRDMMATMEQLTTKRAEARQMRIIFNDNHPPLLQLEREIEVIETQALPAQARELASNLDLQVSDLDQRIGASTREMQQIPVRFTEEQRLERNVDVATLIYTQLQSAFEQARLSELSAVAEVRLLDSAVPPTRPVRDRLLIIIAMCVLGGVGLGAASAVGLEMLDPRIRYPEQVTHGLGLTVLGALPMVKKTRSGAQDPEALARLLEATRSVRMALLYAHGVAGPFVTTVTSPGPGDGKSFTSLELAKSFAASGRRTLLVDGDNRRGVLHRTLHVERKPGLMDVLAGQVPVADAIQTLPEGGFDFLPCGTRKANAPEMLASPAMQRLMMEWRTQYQAIIIDSPPLGAGVDPLVLSSLTGSLVLVLRTGVTDRAFAGARMEALTRLPIRVLGALLNDVKAEGVYRYYSYLPGYAAEDEVESDAPAGRLIGGVKS